MNRSSLYEVFWILGIFIISFGVIFILSGEEIFEKDFIEVQLYNTYIVLELWYLLLYAFLIFLFITYAIKEGFKKFRSIICNFILSISILGSLLVITHFISMLTFSPIEQSATIPFVNLTRTLISIQFVLITGLLFLGIKIGVLSKRQKNSPPIGWRS